MSHFSKYVNINSALGVALGTGYLTSLRFAGLVGISELLILISTLILFRRNSYILTKFGRGIESVVRFYLLFAIFVIAPIITAITYFLSEYSRNSAPEYLLSSALGCALMYLVVAAIRSGQVDLKQLTMWFAITYISANLISIFIFPLNVDVVRYKGGANNPNQFLFYSSSLSLLVIIYWRRLSLLILPVIVYITLKAQSDAYVLSLALIISSYLYLKFFHVKKLSINLNILANLIIFSFAFYVAVIYFGDAIEAIWLGADEGDGRRSLAWNGFLASLQSPLFGWGVGSFSGINSPFEGNEAHSNFLDFSMQFGFLFTIVLYSIPFAAFFSAIKSNQMLIAAFIVGFIVSGLFHYSGRHFVFWIELAALMQLKSVRKEAIKKEG